ncbi:hypothetical protein BHECKSOX_2367 [Bathymodiolus heckerae thiotrophic gill symbiont]|uniref:LOG family protein n=1 Tax=Bathymodiolus heckerae thiotrophic gill symbiont TaxID=1052212 RepID=UPI0010B2E3BC|nr:TIGR00730 family Rossman fold protein [Bathymodiolus heckerae thiotrophic gill symbiont]CAC9542134.1 hypothetical protein [uncultured Gammaproteobacteria bacterium]SHN89772.1 hypothetical protein BHECKSOX_2367 [Bathymodiolus heckerae thiotrophic gill symbiont]
MNTEVIKSELDRAISQLDGLGPSVSIFGSARISQSDPLAQQAFQLGRLLSDLGFNVLTGAGPGIMQAANQGAFERKSKSIGLNIKLPKEQAPNPYLDECILFEHFFTRKVALIKQADACVFFPGGFGTADELLEVLTLIQTRKNKPIKLFLFGTDFWSPIISWFESLAQLGYIDKTDLELLHLVDDFSQIINDIKR